MIVDHKKYELFGKPMLHKVVLKPPFTFTFPISDNACFLYMLEGEMQYEADGNQVPVPHKHSLFLNCIQSTKQVSTSNTSRVNEVVIVNFHPDILKKIYDREMPALLRAPEKKVPNRSVEVINNDYLIQKYIEGLLFYFENPALINEDILVLKLKEIILLLSQTRNAEAIQVILSQLFSPAAYSFRQIIEANLFSPLSIEELAQHTNLSVSTFKREFTKIYHDTPGNYIKNKRLEKAAELLVVSKERITDIAFQCGFNDLAHFTKSFHDRYKASPSEYRSNHTGGSELN